MDEILKVLVIGNGYDLAHGLKTSYKDFISFIINNENDKIKISCKKSDNVKGIFEEIQDNNPFILYLKDYCRAVHTWVDFETEIKKITNSVFTSLKKINHSNNNEVYLKDCPLSKYDIQNLRYFQFISKTVYSELNNTVTMEPRIYNDVYGVNWEIVNEDFRNALSDLKRALIIYLKYYMPEISERNKYVSQIDAIKPDKIISFNYTDTYRRYDCGDVVHVHGKLSENNIVLGYDDSDKDDIDLIIFKKYFQRIENKLPNISEKTFKWRGALGTNYKSDIYVYGMSLDKTDEDLIKEIYRYSRHFYVYYMDDGRDRMYKIKNLISVLGKDEFNNGYYGERIQFIAIKNE